MSGVSLSMAMELLSFGKILLRNSTPVPPRSAIGVLLGREAAGPDLLGILAHRFPDRVAEKAVALDEFRRELGEQAEHVVGDQDLAVAGRRAADPDRRDRDRPGQLARDALSGP